jgi:hypothetical protein
MWEIICEEPPLMKSQNYIRFEANTTMSVEREKYSFCILISRLLNSKRQNKSFLI